MHKPQSHQFVNLVKLNLIAIWISIFLVTYSCAQDYPKKSIRIIAGFVPGGGSDFIARLVANKLTESFNKSVIVENRPGAGAALATDLVAKSASDGYTLLLASAGPFGIIPALSSQTSYNALIDFAPITQVVSMPFVMTVNPKLNIYAIKDLISHAKSNPGQLNFGSPGNGSTNHLAGEMLKVLAKINMTHVPYKGVAAAMADAISGEIQILSGDLTTLIPPVESGKLRAIAVTSRVRSVLLPDIPTIAESGVADYDASGWFGIVAPAKTSTAIVDKLNKAIVKGILTPESKLRLSKLGGDVIASTPAEFSNYIKSDNAKWKKLIDTIGLRDKSNP
jgi:tripartite-type tricarboxylate transporter receptor subunit TctC